MDKVMVYITFVSKFLKELAQKNSNLILIFLGILIIMTCLMDVSLAAETGEKVFKNAASNIVCKVISGKFGAMLTVFAGVFAIIAAATGSYKGAWALLFVSIGAFIFKEFVSILFSSSIVCT